MKIGVVSDSHDNIPNIEKFLDWADKNNIEMLIHCGDISAGSVILRLFGPRFSKPTHLIYGNVADREKIKGAAAKFPNIILDGDEGKIDVDGKKIGFCHYPDQAKEMAQTGKYDVIFYGHTHKPWDEKIGRTRLLNPGTLAGMFYRASFAVYDTKNGEAKLIILDQIV